MEAGFTPRRIVCLQPSATVILHALGKLDCVVACTRYCADVVPQVRDSRRLIVSDSWTAKAEEILSAQPDLVIAAVPYREKSLTEILKAGVRFLGLAPKRLADIFGDIATISGTVGASESGERVISAMQQAIAAVRAAVAGSRIPTAIENPESKTGRPRVYCEEWGKPLIHSQPWVAEMVEAAGGEFVGRPGLQTTSDAILAEDPDVIIAAWCGAGDRVPLDRIVRERGWAGMRTVRAGRVYCIRDELLNTPAPTLLLGLRALASAIHPQKFPHAYGLRCLTAVGPDAAVSAPAYP